MWGRRRGIGRRMRRVGGRGKKWNRKRSNRRWRRRQRRRIKRRGRG